MFRSQRRRDLVGRRTGLLIEETCNVGFYDLSLWRWGFMMVDMGFGRIGIDHDPDRAVPRVALDFQHPHTPRLYTSQHCCVAGQAYGVHGRSDKRR